jgi:hypothetical protein
MDKENERKRKFSVLTRISTFVIIIQLVSCFAVLVVDAQHEITFTTADVFEIPSKNSSIRFATNGTYSNAIFENGEWSFEKLFFSELFGPEKLNVTVSATDCDITINPYLVFNRISRGENVKWVIFSYMVLGQGTQVFNLGLDPKEGQLDAILDGEFIGLNHGWSRAPDGTLTITAATTNVTLWYYGYPESYTQKGEFVDEHSVVIGSTFSVAVIVALAIVITRKKKNDENNLMKKHLILPVKTEPGDRA